MDYTKPYTVVSAPYDVDSCVRATVLQKEPVRRIKGGRALVRVLAADDSGVLGLSWFNTPYVADKLIIGQTYYCEGRIGGTMTRRELLHPLVRTEAQVAASPFVAVYPGTEGLPAARQAACAHAALQYVDELADPLPPELLTRYRMPTKAQAVRSIHAPQSAEDLAGARRRLIFEELYMLQIVLKGNRIVKYFNDNPKNFSLQLTLSVMFGFFSNLMVAYYAPQRTEEAIAEFISGTCLAS